MECINCKSEMIKLQSKGIYDRYLCSDYISCRTLMEKDTSMLSVQAYMETLDSAGFSSELWPYYDEISDSDVLKRIDNILKHQFDDIKVKQLKVYLNAFGGVNLDSEEFTKLINNIVDIIDTGEGIVMSRNFQNVLLTCDKQLRDQLKSEINRRRNETAINAVSKDVLTKIEEIVNNVAHIRSEEGYKDFAKIIVNNMCGRWEAVKLPDIERLLKSVDEKLFQFVQEEIEFRERVYSDNIKRERHELLKELTDKVVLGECTVSNEEISKIKDMYGLDFFEALYTQVCSRTNAACNKAAGLSSRASKYANTMFDLSDEKDDQGRPMFKLVSAGEPKDEIPGVLHGWRDQSYHDKVVNEYLNKLTNYLCVDPIIENGAITYKVSDEQFEEIRRAFKPSNETEYCVLCSSKNLSSGKCSNFDCYGSR